MSDKHFVGLDLTGFEDNGIQKPISRVTMMVDDDNAITAGDDTGLELVANNPHATQEMVNAILAQVKGYQYHMMEADSANLDPAAELGDGITAGPVYTVISRISEDGDGYAGVTAPGEAELEEEYPAAGPMTQSFNRQLAQTRSSITKTATEIRLEVINEVEGLSSRITQTAGSLESQISDISGNVSTLSQSVSGISARVDSAETGLSQTVRLAADGLTLTNASGSKLTIDGGQINAETLNLTGRITFNDLSEASKDTIIGAAADAEEALGEANKANNLLESWGVNVREDGEIITYIDGGMIATETLIVSDLYGRIINLYDRNKNVSGRLYISPASSAEYAIELNSNEAMRLRANGYRSTLWMEAGEDDDSCSLGLTWIRDYGYIISCGGDLIPRSTWECVGVASYPWDTMTAYNYENASDREKKTAIDYDLSAYDEVFDKLRPASYQYRDGKSGRTHLGLIAQDVEQAMEQAGMDGTAFAGLVIGDLAEKKNYFLRYNEIFTLCIRQIQQLKARVAALERRNDG